MKKYVSISIGLLSIVAIFLSNSAGVSGASTSGCTCHGNTPSGNTTVEILNLPSEFEAGQAYNLQAVVKNNTKSYAGLNISATSGFLSAGTVTKVMSNEITHIAKVQLNSGSAVFDFTWTANTTPGDSVTFNVAANAVNGDVGTGGDEWGLASFTVQQKDTGISIRNLEERNFELYPSPAQNNLKLKAQSSVSHIDVYDISGKRYNVSTKITSNEAVINTSVLPAGHYILQWNENDHRRSATFSKE